jgi:signal transduction histidine kinase
MGAREGKRAMAGTWSLRTGRDRGGAAPNVVEVVLAVLLSAVPVAVAAGVIHLSGTRPGVAASLGVIALTLPAAWSRPRPLTAAAVLAVAAVANGLLFGHLVRCGVALPAVYIVGFGIGARLGWPRAAAGLALCAADVVAEGYYDPQIGWPGLVTVLPLLLIFFALGRLLRARSRTAQELGAKSALLRQQREETARLAIAADRAGMSTAIDESLRDRLGVIADTAAAVLRPEAGDAEAGDPETVKRALAAIERDGRAALGELREVVGTLRQPDSVASAAPVGPQPSLARLPELLRGLPAARARLTIEGQPRPLPASLELSGYRIVEHLVRAVQDSPGARIEVRLRYTPETLELHVQGTAVPVPDLRPVLAATRQRAALHGGTMDSRLEGGAFQATALLPLVSGYASP